MAGRCWKWYAGLLQATLIASLLRGRPSASPAAGSRGGGDDLMPPNSDWTPPWTGLAPVVLSSGASPDWTRHRVDSKSPGWPRSCADGGTRGAEMCVDCDKRWQRGCDGRWQRGCDERLECGCETVRSCDGATSANERVKSEFSLPVKTLQLQQLSEQPLAPGLPLLKRPDWELSALGRRQWLLLEELNSLGRYDRLHSAGADIQAYQVTGGGTALSQSAGGGQVTIGTDRTSPGLTSVRAARSELIAPLPPPSGRTPDAGAAVSAAAAPGDISDAGEEDGPAEHGAPAGSGISSDTAAVQLTLTFRDPLMNSNAPETPDSEWQLNATSEKNDTRSGLDGVSPYLSAVLPGPDTAAPAPLSPITAPPAPLGPVTAPPDSTRVEPDLVWSPAGPERHLPQAVVAPGGLSLWEMVDADLAQEDAEETEREAEEVERGAHRCPPRSPQRRSDSRDRSVGLDPEHDPGHDSKLDPGNGLEHVDQHVGENVGENNHENDLALEQTNLATTSDAESECCDVDLVKPAASWNASVSGSESGVLDEVAPARWDDAWCGDSAGRGVDWLVWDSEQWSPSDSEGRGPRRARSPDASSDSAFPDAAGLGLGPMLAGLELNPRWGSARDSQWLESAEGASATDSGASPSEASPSEASRSEASLSDACLSDEDAEVIEALLQQDIDLGLTRHDFDPVRSPLEDVDPVPEKSARLDDEWLSSKVAGTSDESPEDPLDNIWAGLDYTIDSETGEYMLLPSAAPAPSGPADLPSVAPPVGGPLSSPLGGDARRDEPLLSGPIPTTIDDLMGTATASSPQELVRRLPHSSGDSGQGSLTDSDSEIALLDQMIEAAHSHGHTSTLQPRVPLHRMVSMEQRWQDLASLLLLPPGQDAQLPPPPPPPPHQQRHLQQTTTSEQFLLQTGFPSETAAVSQQAPLSAAPPLGLHSQLPSPALADAGASGGELTYFQLSPATVLAGPAGAAMPPLAQDDAFLSELLGVDQMDLSAVPFTEISPLDWSTSNKSVGGDSPAQSPAGDHNQSSQSGSRDLGSLRSTGPAGPGSDANGHPPRLPVAQKKHQMYGKRFFQGQGQDGAYDDSSRSSDVTVSPSRPSSSPAPQTQRQRYGTEGGLSAAFPPPGQAATASEPAEVKYSRMPQFTRMSPTEQLETVAHNHSYHQPAAAESATDTSRPVARDKAADKKSAERVSRDEKRLRSMDVPMTAEEIVYMPMDDFNERLAKMQLTESQLSLVRDVRRRGKNKLAAQNCRKRKLDQITSLTEDLQKVRDHRQRMLADHQFLTEERSRIRDKYAQLHRHVFQSLRDEDNQPYSPSEYSLQLSADGDVLLVPRGPARGAAIVPTAVARHKRPGLHE